MKIKYFAIENINLQLKTITHSERRKNNIKTLRNQRKKNEWKVLTPSYSSKLNTYLKPGNNLMEQYHESTHYLVLQLQKQKKEKKESWDCKNILTLNQCC